MFRQWFSTGCSVLRFCQLYFLPLLTLFGECFHLAVSAGLGYPPSLLAWVLTFPHLTGLLYSRVLLVVCFLGEIRGDRFETMSNSVLHFLWRGLCHGGGGY